MPLKGKAVTVYVTDREYQAIRLAADTQYGSINQVMGAGMRLLLGLQSPQQYQSQRILQRLGYDPDLYDLDVQYQEIPVTNLMDERYMVQYLLGGE